MTWKRFLLLKSAIFAFPHECHKKPTTATTTWNSKQKLKSAIFRFFSHSFSEKILLEIDQPFVYKLHFDILHRYNRITIHTEESTIQEYFKLIHQEFNHKMDYINKNLLRQLLICILCKIEKLLTHTFTYQKNETLEIQFKKMVDLHFKEWHHLHNYLQRLNTSRKHIDKIIFQKYKKKPTDLIDEKLINQSKMLLQYSEHSIKHISIYLGFTDVSNYCKFFKIHTGVTPNEYRRLVIQEGLFSLSHNRWHAS